ncbi:MAG: ACP S-malonyltransferase [Desulfobacterales bacterium]|nr:ACP S-malonyltransferase [Desulfobacterales bacterium]
MRPVVFMYSGQGSQYYHMGKGLFSRHAVFRKWMRLLDEQAADLLGESILDRLYDGNTRKGDPFDQERYSNPALFMQQYALTRVLLEAGVRPDAVLGASLGEFVCAAVSGALPVEDALTAVIQLAEDLDRHCPLGGMLAILHGPDIYEETPLIRENSSLAGINFHSHHVVSGDDNGLRIIADFLSGKDVNFLRLPVSKAFHSWRIDPAGPAFTAFLRGINFSPPDVPFISCRRARRARDVSSDYLWKTVREPILFRETIRNMEREGPPRVHVDLGPSGTLANFVGYNLGQNPRSEYMSILTPFGHDEDHLEKALKYFLKNPAPPRGPGFQKTQKKGVHMKTYLFPGQGSQKKGMGGSLFDEFRELTEMADDISGYSMKKLCLEDPENLLGRTEYTQPALFVVNALTWMKKEEEEDRPPDFLAGHSLGEYNALFAAGVFDFETGLRLVRERGRLMSRARGGGMAAVIGFQKEKIRDVLRENHFINISLANYNSPLQIVISGSAEDIASAKPFFEDAGVRLYHPLNVSGAFHSRYMREAAKDFTGFLDRFTFNEPQIPVIANVTARPYPGAEVKELLAAQITSSVQWTDSMSWLMERGRMEFEEIGPGNVLSGLIRKIRLEIAPPTLDRRSVGDERRREEDRRTRAEAAAPDQETRKEDAGDRRQRGGDRREAPKDRRVGRPDRRRQPVDRKRAGLVITASSLGSAAFKREYNLQYAYLAGAMFRGIASKELVVAMGRAGMMGFLGTGGMGLDAIEDAIRHIRETLPDKPHGVNFLHNHDNPGAEDALVDLYLRLEVRHVEAAAFIEMTPALVRYRLKGLHRGENGEIIPSNKVMAKLSRPEVATAFLQPAPDRIVQKMLQEGKITEEQAALSQRIPMTDAICVEADSGGHTDGGVAYALMPAMMAVRDRITRERGYKRKVYIGAAGGVGSPHAAAAAFVLGADFILTGSINQCTVEAGTSDMVKDLLQQMNVQDTDYAPAGDMFEIGAKVQVLRKGVFFPARANKLYELHQRCESLDEIDEKTRSQLEKRYFKRSFEEIWEETKTFFSRVDPEQIRRAEKSPKYKMALVFRWYLGVTGQMAIDGVKEEKVNFQIHTGPALGAFNQWVRGTELEDWRNRRVGEIGKKLMHETAVLLNGRFEDMTWREEGVA